MHKGEIMLKNINRGARYVIIFTLIIALSSWYPKLIGGLTFKDIVPLEYSSERYEFNVKFFVILACHPLGISSISILTSVTALPHFSS